MQEIVLLEDDALLRITLAELLEINGYVVHQAQTGSQALRACEGGAETGCVLIADRFLHGDGDSEGADGHQIAADALARWPWIAVIYTSGAPEAADRVLSARERVLVKPFQFAALHQALRALSG